MSTLKSLSLFIAVLAILFDAATAIAAKSGASLTRAGLAELEMQILLDRADFSPGEIDDKSGKNSREALAAFEAARGISGARSHKALLQALGAGSFKPTVSYTITSEEAAGPFLKTIPVDMTAMAKLPGLYYRSVLEELGEKFHSAPALLKRLNPHAHFIAGEHIRVPNVIPREQNLSKGRSEGINAFLTEAKLVKVVVSKKTSSLTVFDGKDRVVFRAPVTSGSEHDPLPLGNWVVTLVQRNPTYNYNPDLFWDANPANAKVTIAPGPNNPVGVIWIEIDKPHYGIHGTPEPGRIGHSESHGCVRLTNWDVTKLASLVTKGTVVVFQE